MSAPYLDDSAYPPELTRDEALAEQAREHEMVEEQWAEVQRQESYVFRWYWFLGEPERAA